MVSWSLRDFWGRWAVDHAGVEVGSYRLSDLESLLRDGTITPHTWLRHVWTRKFALAGEVLAHHGRVSDEEFASWFPNPKPAH